MTRLMTDQEVNTVLHALRCLYGKCERACDHFEDAGPLTSPEVGALCEQIGLGGVRLEYDEDAELDPVTERVLAKLDEAEGK